MMTAVLIMAGGTGGHVFPALAVAEVLRARGHEPVWLGTRAGLEATLVPRAGFPLEWLAITGLRGKGTLAWLAAPFRLGRALAQALAVLRRVRPAVVLGMGGFASGPGGLAAWLMRIPLVVHEQNAVAGLTNRWLARFATRTLTAFPAALPHAEHVGNPLRAALQDVPPPRLRLAGRTGPLRLLVLGGSQGARALNETVPHALARLASNRRPEVLHQTGARHLETTRALYGALGIAARVEPFIDDMAAAYLWADLVVCRAGAMTIAEIAAVGVASVLVPFPAAVDDHQTHNARHLAAAGAAVLLPERDLGAERLAALIDGLAARPDELVKMAERARALAMPGAAERVADVCLELARRNAE
ncbi:MAG TPA: undecaprenyldiphospho-muramoylpentapeptide beta-N-acetylglucosaminyltransferase [Gammaproteobacteria bacterium]|nr:undecaprenyldiphospho-muramoylpentapeptide beta-N-acetylglucosaminyltransferase [Gammaproteobacteria bacterium]